MNKERGAILPILAITIIAIIGIVAWLVDLSRTSYAVNTIQEAVDAASISAVRQLNGKLEGWENAQSAALLALQSNPISEVPANALERITLTESSELGDNTQKIQNGVKVKVARGVYWFDDTSNSQRFVSLEEGAENDKGPWKHKDFAKHIFADAVKVELTLVQLDASGFAKVGGTESFNNLTKKSVAVSDNQLKSPVFPGGVPYCQLMLESDANETTQHLLTDYDPAKSSDRELYFTELQGFVTGSSDADTGSNYDGVSLPTANRERREGLRRYISHIYRPMYNVTGSNLCNDSIGTAVSCKHPPIQGLLGVYGPEPGPTSIAELQAQLESSEEGDAKVQLGQHFKPLAEWPTGDVSSISESMQHFLDTGEETIGSLYTTTNSSGTRINAKFFNSPGIAPRTNFPAVRHAQTSSGNSDFMKRPLLYAGSGVDDYATNRINWPLRIGSTEYRFGLLLGLNRVSDTNPAGTRVPFINPLCNSAEENLDKTDYKVKRYSVMVIAPSSEEETYSEDQVSYCDFDNQFLGQEQNAKVPWWKNEPRVVGVVPIDFIGFNFEDLDARFVDNTPQYSEPGGATIIDDNPGRLELGANFRPEVEQFEEEYNECTSNVNANPNSCQLNINSVVALPTEISSCFDNSAYLGFQNNLDDISSKATECENKMFTEDCEPDDTVCNQKKNAYQVCLNQLNGQVNITTIVYQSHIFNIPAKQDVHCLPLPKEDAFDLSASNSYEQPLSSLRAGRGCGGVRAKVSDKGGEPPLLTTGKKWSEMTPMLVENAE